MTATISPADERDRREARPAVDSRVRRLIRRLPPIGAATLSGALLYLSFPPRPLWWLAVPALAGLGWCLRGRSWKTGLGLGFVFGLGFLVPLLAWTGEDVGPLPWLALSVAEALFVAGTGAGIAVVSRLPLWPLWASGVWIAGEALRARFPFGGFPWGKLAFGQPEGVFLPLAALGGTPLLSFAVVLCGFGLAGLAQLLKAGRRARDRGVWAAAALVAAPVVAGVAASPLVDVGAEEGTAKVAVIQGNVPRMGLDFNSQRRAVLDNHVRETRRLAARVEAGKAEQPDLVLWPENSSDIDPYINADARRAINRVAKEIKAPISVGAVTAPENGSPRNRQILWDPETGPGAVYDKRHLQPFGEYMPYRSFFRLFSPAVDRSGNFEPGDRTAVFDMAGTKVGPVTCYEAAFDSTVRDQVRAGAQILSVPSNNATFGRSQMTYQQLAMDRVRAVEHGRAVLVPVTSGVSAVIMPDGRIVQRTELFTADTLVADVPRRSSLTPATRLGVLPELALLALAAGGLGQVAVRTLRTRRGAGE